MATSESERSVCSTPKRTRTGKYCAVAECTGRNSDGISLHNFPSDSDLRKKWTDFVCARREDFGPKYGTPNVNSFVCSRHFTADDYPLADGLYASFNIPRRRSRLKSDAVPSIQKHTFSAGQRTCQIHTSTSERSAITTVASSTFTTATTTTVYRASVATVLPGVSTVRGAFVKRRRKRVLDAVGEATNMPSDINKPPSPGMGDHTQMQAADACVHTEANWNRLSVVDFDKELWWPTIDHIYCRRLTSIENEESDGSAQPDKNKRHEHGRRKGPGMCTRSQQRRGVCCVVGCRHAQHEKVKGRVTFFPFPLKESRCRRWVENSGQTRLEGKSPLQIRAKGHRLCHLHFDAKQFQSSQPPRRLLGTAVPRLFSAARRQTHKQTEVIGSSKRHRRAKGRQESEGEGGDGGEGQAGVSLELDVADDPTQPWGPFGLPADGGGGQDKSITVTLSCEGVVGMNFHPSPPPGKSPFVAGLRLEPDDSDEASCSSCVESDLPEQTNDDEGKTGAWNSGANNEFGDDLKIEPDRSMVNNQGREIYYEESTQSIADTHSVIMDGLDSETTSLASSVKKEVETHAQMPENIKEEPADDEQYPEKNETETRLIELDRIKLEPIDDCYCDAAGARELLRVTEDAIKSEPLHDEMFSTNEEEPHKLTEDCIKAEPSQDQTFSTNEENAHQSTNEVVKSEPLHLQMFSANKESEKDADPAAEPWSHATDDALYSNFEVKIEPSDSDDQCTDDQSKQFSDNVHPSEGIKCEAVDEDGFLSEGSGQVSGVGEKMEHVSGDRLRCEESRSVHLLRRVTEDKGAVDWLAFPSSHVAADADSEEDDNVRRDNSEVRETHTINDPDISVDDTL